MVLLSISSRTLGDRTTGEIAAKNNNLWDEAILNAIIEYFLQAVKCQRMVKPYIGQEEKIEVWKSVSYSYRILGLPRG
jgi:hypothetical protein